MEIMVLALARGENDCSDQIILLDLNNIVILIFAHILLQADSGSPMRSKDGYLVGLVSSGIDDCGRGGIEIYTNVYRYLLIS